MAIAFPTDRLEMSTGKTLLHFEYIIKHAFPTRPVYTCVYALIALSLLQGLALQSSHFDTHQASVANARDTASADLPLQNIFSTSMKCYSEKTTFLAYSMQAMRAWHVSILILKRAISSLVNTQITVQLQCLSDGYQWARACSLPQE